ncbi:MAG: hypothetical protein OXJ64_09635 [Boseongicola sp.]|nr:hypothetical protein [Boseongicola sp.]
MPAQNTKESGEARFNLSLASLILLITSIIALVGWGVRIEHKASRDAIREIVEEKLQGHPASLPPGSIIAYLGKDTSAPDGWSICGKGAGQFPDLAGSFLVGTSDFNEVGKPTGSSDHQHTVDITSQGERDGKFSSRTDFADNRAGKNWFHSHQVRGSTQNADHIPPAIHVLFFCKQAPHSE